MRQATTAVGVSLVSTHLIQRTSPYVATFNSQRRISAYTQSTEAQSCTRADLDPLYQVVPANQMRFCICASISMRRPPPHTGQHRSSRHCVCRWNESLAPAPAPRPSNFFSIPFSRPSVDNLSPRSPTRRATALSKGEGSHNVKLFSLTLQNSL